VTPTFPPICAFAQPSLPSSENRWDINNADHHAHLRSIPYSLTSLLQRRHRAWKRMLIWRPCTLAMSAGLLHGTEWLICCRPRVSPILTQSNQRHPQTGTTSSLFRKINRPAPGHPEVRPSRRDSTPLGVLYPRANAYFLPAPTSQPRTPTYPSSSLSRKSLTQTSPTKSLSSRSTS